MVKWDSNYCTCFVAFDRPLAATNLRAEARERCHLKRSSKLKLLRSKEGKQVLIIKFFNAGFAFLRPRKTSEKSREKWNRDHGSSAPRKGRVLQTSKEAYS